MLAVLIPPPPPGKDRPYFPIWDTPISFANYISHLNDPAGWDYKIPNSVISAFEQVQPYHAGYERLSLFKTLVNVDKHRLPIVAQWEVDHFLITVNKINIKPESNPDFYDRGYDKSQVKAQATVYVTWQDPFMPKEPVVRTMENFVELVANIVPRFERFCI